MWREGGVPSPYCLVRSCWLRVRGMKVEKGLWGSGGPLSNYRMHDGKSWPSLEGLAGWVTWNLECLGGIALSSPGSPSRGAEKGKKEWESYEHVPVRGLWRKGGDKGCRERGH